LVIKDRHLPQGNGKVDPTANVIALVESNRVAAVDLREADNKFYDAQSKHIVEMATLRASHAETLRVSDLDRLDKTRQVDVLAAAASAATLATAVQTLANTSDRNAEAQRNLVSQTAQTMAKQTADQAQVLSAQMDTVVKDINGRIAELQKSQYQGVGKSSIADPAMESLVLEVRKISAAQLVTTGAKQGFDKSWAIIVAVLTLAVAIWFGSNRVAGFTAQPQVVYVPAPATVLQHNDAK
jgi:hypothetical protein